MKFALILAAILVAVSAELHPHMVQQEWIIFKSKHVKVYESVEEEAKRMAIFHQNLVKIEEHNKLYKQGLSTFKMGVTKFADMTSEEFMAYVNKSAVIGHPKVHGEKVIPSNDTPPDSVDWRTKNVLTPVKDQGSCRASWNFVATGALEAAYALAHGELISLSEQELIDCSQIYGNDGCNGGSTLYAYSYVSNLGIASEKDYPYENKMGACQLVKRSPVKLNLLFFVLPTFDRFRLMLSKQPLSVSVDVTDSWQHYTGGILDCSFENINNSILAVGYDPQSWILKNSWGSSWGEGGYIRLSNSKNCGIQDFAFGITAE